MLKEGCPGSTEIRSPYPQDITCFWCSANNEIWSDETETQCKGCGKKITRDPAPSCLEWCPAAKECVGAEKYERFMQACNRRDK
ncbi:MAG: phosphohydrolase [Thermodesulfovibrionales bacterium]